MLKTPHRFVQYVCAVVKHFYLIGVGIFFTFLPFAESIPFRAIQTGALVIQPYHIWSRWIGLSLIFLATFLAWNAERDAREIAEASPENLQQRIGELERKQRRRITSAQRKLFLDAAQRVDIKQIGSSIYISCREGDGEAGTYFLDLIDLFESVNISARGGPHISGSDYDSLGLAVIIPNPDSKSDRAKVIIDLLNSAKIEYKLARKGDDPLESLRLHVGKQMEMVGK
jgi:hypothetical protein